MIIEEARGDAQPQIPQALRRVVRSGMDAP